LLRTSQPNPCTSSKRKGNTYSRWLKRKREARTVVISLRALPTALIRTFPRGRMTRKTPERTWLTIQCGKSGVLQPYHRKFTIHLNSSMAAAQRVSCHLYTSTDRVLLVIATFAPVAAYHCATAAAYTHGGAGRLCSSPILMSGSRRCSSLLQMAYAQIF